MYRWLVVGMLWLVCFFNYADRQAIFSVFEPIKSEMKLTDPQLGVIGSAFMWVYAAIGPIAGIVGDRFRRKTLIIGGLIFWSAITLATALAQEYWHLVLCRALEGFGEAFYFPASMSLISDYHGRDTRSRAMSLHQSSVYAGTIAGGALSGFMAQHYQSWRASFYWFGWFGIALGILLLLVLKEPRRGQSEAETSPAEKVPFRSIFAHPMVPVLMLVFVGANFVASIFLSWMPTFLLRKFHMSLSMAGLNATAYLQIASVLGVITGGVVADRLAKRYRGGRMIAQTIGLLAGFPFIFLTGWTLAVPVLVLAMAGFGYFKGLYDANLWASLYDVVPTTSRATAVGFMNSIGWFGGGLAPIVIAYSSERFGMSASISASSVIYLTLGIVMAFAIRRFMSGNVAPGQAPQNQRATTQS